jgi:hypothetical protein
LKRLDGSFLSYPEQTRDANVDLVDQGQAFMTLGVLDFVDANGIDLPLFPMFQSPSGDMFDCIEDLVPGGPECRRRFSPGRPARPSRQGTSSTTTASQRWQSTRRMV